METVLTELLNNLLPILATAIGGLIAYFGNQIKKRYDEKYKNDTIDKVISSTVEYIEQTLKSEDGKAKLEKATEISLQRLNEKGIDIDEIELNIIIEAFVRGLK